MRIKKSKIITTSIGSIALFGGLVTQVQADVIKSPSGNVIARGEDGVPWELYENGYLLFKPVSGKDTLVGGVEGKSSWKVNHGTKIKSIGFSGKVYAPADSSNLFANISHNPGNGYVKLLDNLEYIDSAKIDTNRVINMERMFAGLTNLKELDVSQFNTSKVTNMESLFHDVSSLTTLNVSNWDTRMVTNMYQVFTNMRSLKSLDVSRWKTSSVTNMSNLFRGLEHLTSLDVSNWDTSKVTDMRFMFWDASSLERLELGNWNVQNVTRMNGMFRGTNELDTLDISNWNTRSVTDMSEMFGPSNYTGPATKLRLIKFGPNFKNTSYTGELFKNLDKHSLGDRYSEKWEKLHSTYVLSTSELNSKYRVEPEKYSGEWVREMKFFEVELTFDMGTHPAIPKVIARFSRNGNETSPLFTLPTPKNPENLRFVGWVASKDPSSGVITNENRGALYFFSDIGKLKLYPKWEVIPKEPKTVTEVIEPTKEFVIDETRDKGAKNLETPGKKGSKTIKITYTINPETGVATENRGEPIIDSAGKTIVKVAAKPETRQVVGNDGNKYEETTKYTINASNGDLTPNSTRRLVENTKAIEAINAEAKKKNDEIEAANITQEAKTRLKAKVEGERTKGIDAVKRMDTVEKGNAERDKALAAIRAISLNADKQAKEAADLKKAKDAGIDAIKKAAEDKKVEINAADLLPEAKSRLLAQEKVRRIKE